MATRIGIISDTHLHFGDESFREDIKRLFKDCHLIVHAGDITEMSVLDCFDAEKLIGVHGNMCSSEVKSYLPESRVLTVDGYLIGICHGAGPYETIEDRLLQKFPDADCIIYGHTHRPANHRSGTILFLNPGSFTGTGPYGSPGTYALLETSETQLTAEICTRPRR